MKPSFVRSFVDPLARICMHSRVYADADVVDVVKDVDDINSGRLTVSSALGQQQR